MVGALKPESQQSSVSMYERFPRKSDLSSESLPHKHVSP